MNLICPICKEVLKQVDKSYKCINNHCFDISKEGYLNLYLKKSANSGDEKDMVKARRDFLNKDYYLFLKQKINELVKGKESLVDLGCGEGYYTSYFEVNDKVGIDLSKETLKIASKKDKGTKYILSSIFNTPLNDKCADIVVTCFAPIAKEEIKRILKDNGHFILVRPDTNHLIELKSAVYDNPYLNEVEDIEIEDMELINEYHISSNALLNNEELNNLFMMTPYYHTTSKEDIKKLNSISELSITFSFIVSDYKKK